MTHISHVSYTAWLPVVTHVTFTELLVYDSCYEQSMTRILYDSCHFHNMHVTYMIHATCAAWLISCKLQDSFITNVTIYIQYSKTHTVCIIVYDSYRLNYLTHVWIIIRTYQDSYVTHVTYNAWLVFDSCYVHNTTLLAYDSSGHLNNLTPVWFTSRSQHDS